MDFNHYDFFSEEYTPKNEDTYSYKFNEADIFDSNSLNNDLASIEIYDKYGKKMSLLDKYKKNCATLSNLQNHTRSIEESNETYKKYVDQKLATIKKLQTKLSKSEKNVEDLSLEVCKLKNEKSSQTNLYQAQTQIDITKLKRQNEKIKNLEEIKHDLSEKNCKLKTKLNEIKNKLELKEKENANIQNSNETMKLEMNRNSDEIRQQRIFILNFTKSFQELAKKNKELEHQLNSSLKKEKFKANCLIRGFKYISFDIRKMTNFVSLVDTTNDPLLDFLNISHKIARMTPEKNKIKQLKTNYCLRMHNINNILDTIKKISTFVENKVNTLNSEPSEFEQQKSKNDKLRKLYSEKIKKMEKEKKDLVENNKKKTGEMENLSNKYSQLNSELKEQNEKQIDTLKLKKVELTKYVQIYQQIKEDSKKIFEFECLKCFKHNKFDVDITKTDSKSMNCINCEKECAKLQSKRKNDLSQIQDTPEIIESSPKVTQKKTKEKKKRKKRTDDAPLIKQEVVNKNVNAKICLDYLEKEEFEAEKMYKDVYVKIEGVNIYSKKYRSLVLTNLDPFPEKEFSELYDQMLKTRETKVSRQTRSGNTYNVTNHKTTTITPMLYPKLHEIIKQLLCFPDKNRLALLVYLRLFACWITNATNDSRPWIKPPPINPLEQFDLINSGGNKVKLHDLTHYDSKKKKKLRRKAPM